MTPAELITETARRWDERERTFPRFTRRPWATSWDALDMIGKARLAAEVERGRLL